MVPMDEDEYAQSKRYVAYDSLEVHFRKADGTHRVEWGFDPFVGHNTGGTIWMELHPDHAAEVMAGKKVPFWEAFHKSPRPVEVRVTTHDSTYKDWGPTVTICYSMAAWIESHPDWFTDEATIPMDDSGEDWG